MVSIAMAQAPVFTGIPDVKLYAGKSLSSAFDLALYNTSDAGSTFSVVTGVDVASITSGAPGTVSYYGLVVASSTWRHVSFSGTNAGGTGIGNQLVKYSTFLVNKLGRVSLIAADTAVIDISAAIDTAAVPSYPGATAWPLSFSTTGAVVADAGLTAAIDNVGKTLTISNAAALSGKKYVRIIAAPAAAPNLGDYDKGILQVYPNLVVNGNFNAALGSEWNVQNYADGTLPIPTPTIVASFAGKTNVFKANLTIGKKIQASQVIATSPSTWYTARAKVATDATDVAGSKLKTYLYIQNDPIGGIKFSAHDVGANGQMIGPNVWNPMEISFYAQATDCAIQFVSISPATASTTADLYWDDIEMFQAPPAVIDSDLTYGYTKVAVNNGTFDSSTVGWYPEVYADGTGIGTIAWAASQSGKSGEYSIAQTAGQKAKISQYGGAGSLAPMAEQLAQGKSVQLSAWVLSNADTQAHTGKYYAYIYAYGSDTSTIRRSIASIVQPGAIAPNTWTQIQAAGVLFTNIGGIQVVVIDPASSVAQTQFIDDVTLNTDKDPIYFWNNVLFP